MRRQRESFQNQISELRELYLSEKNQRIVEKKQREKELRRVEDQQQNLQFQLKSLKDDSITASAGILAKMATEIETQARKIQLELEQLKKKDEETSKNEIRFSTMLVTHIVNEYGAPSFAEDHSHADVPVFLKAIELGLSVILRTSYKKHNVFNLAFGNRQQLDNDKNFVKKLNDEQIFDNMTPPIIFGDYGLETFVEHKQTNSSKKYRPPNKRMGDATESQIYFCILAPLHVKLKISANGQMSSCETEAKEKMYKNKKYKCFIFKIKLLNEERNSQQFRGFYHSVSWRVLWVSLLLTC